MLFRSIERQGPGTNLNCIIPVQRLLAQMNVRMTTAVDGWLATHAGLTSQFADIVLEIDVEDESFDEPSYTAESLANQVNTAFDHALSEMFENGNDEELLLFNLCGPGRGGISIPGPLWASTSELTVLGMPHLNQIIGHTPVYSVCELEERGLSLIHIYGGHLVTVAKAQDGKAQVVDGGIDRGRVLGVHGRGATGEDQRRWRHLPHLIRRDIAGHDLGVHVQVAHATGDELRVLGAKVEDQDLLCGPLGCHLGHKPSQLSRRPDGYMC